MFCEGTIRISARRRPPGLGATRQDRGPTVTLAIDGASVTRARRHVDHARGGARRPLDIPKLCATDTPEELRLLPPLPGRGRGPARLSRFVHHAGRRGHEGSHREPQAHEASSRRHGAVRLRPSARLHDLPGQRPLRAAGHGRASRTSRPRGTASTGANHHDAANATPAILTSSSIQSLCIVCSRCVRACDEVQGTFALTIQGRGFASQVVASPARAVPGLRVRLVRPVRRGLPDRRPHREVRRAARRGRARRRRRRARTAASAARSRPR